MRLIEQLTGERRDVVGEIKAHSGRGKMIWGTGSVAAGVARALEKNGVDFDGYLVDGGLMGKSDERILDKPVHELGDFLTKNTEVYVVVGHSNYQIADELAKKYSSVKQIFMLAMIVRPDIRMDGEFIFNEQDGLQKTYDNLADESSRQNMVDFLNVQISGDATFILRHFTEASTYFRNDVVKYSKDEHYLDIGAYDGKSLKEFLEVCPGAESLAVEVMPKYAKLITDNNENNKNVTVINSGVSSADGFDYFSFDGESTFLTSGRDSVKIPVKTVDTICREYNFSPTIVKMCIGNSVLPIIDGARETIRKSLPKMIITAGIDTRALVDYVPKINEVAGGRYGFYLRYETAMAERLVLYAIPK